jgi:hypothetical protein
LTELKKKKRLVTNTLTKLRKLKRRAS